MIHEFQHEHVHDCQFSMGILNYFDYTKSVEFIKLIIIVINVLIITDFMLIAIFMHSFTFKYLRYLQMKYVFILLIDLKSYFDFREPKCLGFMLELCFIHWEFILDLHFQLYSRCFKLY